MNDVYVISLRALTGFNVVWLGGNLWMTFRLINAWGRLQGQRDSMIASQKSLLDTVGHEL